MVSSLSRVLPTSQVFTSGYVNTETNLHFFYKITNERGMKTVFTYAHEKWFYGQSERAYYLNNFIIKIVPCLWRTKFANFNQSTYKKRFFQICFCLETIYWDIHLILWIRKIFVDKNWCLNNILSKGSFSTGYSLSFKSLSLEEVSNAKNKKKNRTKKKIKNHWRKSKISVWTQLDTKIEIF